MSAELFLAFPYRSQINKTTGELNAGYRKYVEDSIEKLEAHGFEIYSTLREENYSLKDDSGAVKTEIIKARSCAGFIELLDETVSRGNSRLMGIAMNAGKVAMIAHSPELAIGDNDKNLIKLGYLHEIAVPLDPVEIEEHLSSR
jgi:hypothetical protein